MKLVPFVKSSMNQVGTSEATMNKFEVTYGLKQGLVLMVFNLALAYVLSQILIDPRTTV